MKPEILLGSDRTKPCVRQVYGVSGSGKTYFLARMIAASKAGDFPPLHRIIVIDVKHEGYSNLVAEVDHTADETIETIQESRISVMHPEIGNAMDEIDKVIAYAFDTAQRLPDFGATIVIEESSTYVSPTYVPDSIRRLATQGRSLGLSLILANQRALSNRWTDTQSTSITMFRLAIPDRDVLKKRWGVDAEELDNRLSDRKFSFAHYDLENLTLGYFDPIPEKAITKPKKRRKGLSGMSGRFKRSFVKM